MYSSAYRILNNRELASDATQEAFIQVFKILGQFEFRSSLGTWIKTIVIHTALKILRKQKTFVFDDLSDTISHVVWEEPLSGEHLEKAILSMPTGYRAIFLLIEVEGYKHKEVAHMLKISEGTSKSQLFHAKKYLKTLLSSCNN
ncbi:MAG: sigma-70 family RNA polymerase sigma factor [Bacteroidetes bacterium]|nr:sigma-70 family RNA polymerase sigma factor [Bacteroidota bacterium]